MKKLLSVHVHKEEATLTNYEIKKLFKNARKNEQNPFERLGNKVGN